LNHGTGGGKGIKFQGQCYLRMRKGMMIAGGQNSDPMTKCCALGVTEIILQRVR